MIWVNEIEMHNWNGWLPQLGNVLEKWTSYNYSSCVFWLYYIACSLDEDFEMLIGGGIYVLSFMKDDTS